MPYPLVFASSLSVLSFELLLFRIFTIRLSFHYASLIISLSIAGLVIGSLSVYYMQNSGRFNNFLSSQPLNFFAVTLAVSYPSVFLMFSVIPFDHARMLWEHTQILYLVLFIALCAFPFYEFDLEKRVIRYKKSPDDNWKEYVMKEEEQTKAKSFFGVS
jgi:hypothetical protein